MQATTVTTTCPHQAAANPPATPHKLTNTLVFVGVPRRLNYDQDPFNEEQRPQRCRPVSQLTKQRHRPY
jgi:hypothetical protein